MKKNTIIFIIVGLIIAAGCFFGGLKYGEAHPSTANGQFNRGNFAGAGGGGNRGGQGFRGGANGGLVAGQVLNKDDKSMTISLQGGGSRIIFLSASTTVMKAVVGSVSDLATSTTVTVIGSANPDGSINAQSIQIRPAGNFPRTQ